MSNIRIAASRALPALALGVSLPAAVAIAADDVGGLHGVQTSIPNQALISSGRPDPLRDWGLARARLREGLLTAEEAQKMVSTNLEDLAAKRTAPRDTRLDYGSDGIVPLFYRQKLIDERMLRAYVTGHLAGQITFTPRLRVRSNEPLPATLKVAGPYAHWVTPKSLGLKRVVVDGKETTWTDHDRPQEIPGPSGRRIEYLLDHQLPPGEHEVKFVFAVKPILNVVGERPTNDPITEIEQEFPATIAVVPPGSPPSELGLSPVQEKQVEQAFRPRRVVVQNGFFGPRLTVHWWPSPTDLPPCSYGLRPLVNGATISLDTRMFTNPPQPRKPGDPGFMFYLDKPLPEAVQSVDLELTPTITDDLAKIPGTERIAGTRILIRDVPLNRFDLDGDVRPAREMPPPQQDRVADQPRDRHAGTASPESQAYWDDLQVRLSAGSLTPAALESAIDEFARSIARENRASFSFRTQFAAQFVRKNLETGLFTPEMLRKFYATCFKWDGTLKTTVSVIKNPNYPGVIGSTPYLIHVTYKPYWDGSGHPCEEVLWLEGIYRQDGTRLLVRSTVCPEGIGGRPLTQEQADDMVSSDREGYWDLRQDLPAGEHDLVFVFHIGAVPSDEDSRGFVPYWGASRKWPAPGKLWEYRLKQRITIPQWPAR